MRARRVSKLHTRLGELEAAVAGQAAAAERGEGLQRKLAAERVERAAAAMDAAALRRQLLCGPIPSNSTPRLSKQIVTMQGTLLRRWRSGGDILAPAADGKIQATTKLVMAIHRPTPIPVSDRPQPSNSALR